MWALVLQEGRGGLIDASKYREVMTDLFFYGKQRELTAEERRELEANRAREARAAIGQGPTADALAELRRAHEETRARSTSKG